ncbi:MAG: hypothetical protein EBT03_08515 [Betaproteobacteria bacterium]|nr:hypothetical protein [Betaproteobacteria bacterium]NCA16853.1 hypothetical protein [Betaproteobacteria bacterium]
MNEMPEWQKRVVDERDELTGRIDRLEAFLAIPREFTTVYEAAHRKLLHDQLPAMRVYRQILNDRIAMFDRLV